MLGLILEMLPNQQKIAKEVQARREQARKLLRRAINSLHFIVIMEKNTEQMGEIASSSRRRSGLLAMTCLRFVIASDGTERSNLDHTNLSRKNANNFMH